MYALFLIAAAVTVVATALALSRRQAVHGLLFLVVALLGLALIFALLGAPFAAALEVIIYAGAIMVLFLFVVMLVGARGDGSAAPSSLRRAHWLRPALLAAVLLGELLVLLLTAQPAGPPAALVAQQPSAVGRALLGPYQLGVELASFLLLAALVGAVRLAGRDGGAR